ncbi:MAG: DUF1571 domain-containing protein, partial [Chitinophagales bacterium]|nr:DUF1571 domain-containing protein [Chitinophagales bacterium]
MKKVVGLFIMFVVFGQINAQDAKSVVDKMISALSAGKSYEYTMKQTERINGKYVKNTIFTKVQESPKKIFIDNIEGENKGVQVLYASGERDNKALINKMFGIKLSPFNSLIRKNQHHTILESGFGTVLSLIKDAKTKANAQGKFNEVFTLEGTVSYGGKSCYKIVLNDPTFTYVSYKPTANISTYKLSMDKKICEQLVCEANNMGFGDLKAGNTYK